MAEGGKQLREGFEDRSKIHKEVAVGGFVRSRECASHILGNAGLKGEGQNPKSGGGGGSQSGRNCLAWERKNLQ